MERDRRKAKTLSWLSGKGQQLTRLNRLIPIVLGVLLASLASNFASPRTSAASQHVVVNPGDNIAILVNREPPGTTFLIKAGIHRLQSVEPKDGDSFIGESGATLDGAQNLTRFSRSGRLWVAITQPVKPVGNRGKCNQKRPDCLYAQDLFVDDFPLERAGNLETVSPGKWYLDYSTHAAYLADNPAGHRVEMSVASYAFRGASRNVMITGLTIEKYACVAGDGAVDGRSTSGQLSSNWTVENSLIQLNHGIGVRLGDGMHVLKNKLIHNGQLGVGGGGRDIVVDGNEIAFNNYAGYSYGWEAGGSKFAFTRNLIVRNNYAHDNKGPGLWTDIENINTLYEHNHTRSNQEAGILHEISYRAVIRDNTIEKDGFSESGKTEPWYGAGIIIAGSSDVEIYGNIVANCMNGIVGTQPDRELSHQGTPYLLRNLYVHDNTITQGAGMAAGIVRSSVLNDSVFTSRNNRFAHNTFHLTQPNAKSFAWNGSDLSLQEWLTVLNSY